MGQVVQFRQPASEGLYGLAAIRAAWDAAKAAQELPEPVKSPNDYIVEAMFLAMTKAQQMKVMRGIFRARTDNPEVEGLRAALHKVDRMMGVRA